MNSLFASNGNEEKARTCRVALARSLAELPDFVTNSAAGFVLFVAVDALGVSNTEMRATARRLLDMGCAYLSVWGPDCERMHDQFDLERDPNEHRNSTVMTTWHEQETIEKALWFSLTCAWPADGLAGAYAHWVGVSIGSIDWEQKIRDAVSIHGDD